MSRLEITSPNQAQLMIEELYKDLERRIESSPPGLCPVDMTRAFVEMCHTHTCGKCVPCRVGLWQLKNLLNLKLMEELSQSIMNGADCAIGYEAAHTVYRSLKDCREDYEEHVHQGRCTCNYTQPVPCVSLCPAHVDIPGYVSLVREGRYADAIRLIRKDNPFPTTCGFICEHPCEARCRRNIIDDAVNIRGLKRFAADYAGKVPPPACAASTGKKIAIIGGGIGGKVSSKAQLTAVSVVALVFVLLGIFAPIDTMGRMPVFTGTGFAMIEVPIGVMFLTLCGLCTSVMWGGIFNLAVEGLGKYTSMGSGIFMVMVCGGGILPLIQGYVADISNYLSSYWVIIAGLAYMLFYALVGSKNVNKDIPVED